VSSVPASSALECLWEVVAIAVAAHHGASPIQVCGKHFPELFGPNTPTSSQHENLRACSKEILAMIKQMKLSTKDLAKAKSMHENISVAFGQLKVDILQNMADEEARFPALVQTKGWTQKQFFKWIAKDLLPVEMKAAQEANIDGIGQSLLQVAKRMGVLVILLVNCSAVWDTKLQYRKPLWSILPPSIALKLFKQCFSSRWAEPLKVIERERLGHAS